MASVCLPRNYAERENSDFGRYCVGPDVNCRNSQVKKRTGRKMGLKRRR
jgi:hypothetical protein